MNASESLRTFIGVVSSHPLLARLFFASLEFAILALVVAIALRLSRIKSPRLAAVLWLLVLAKPLASLAIGTPLPIVEFEAPLAILTTAQSLPDMQTPQSLPDTAAALPHSFPANMQFGRPAPTGLNGTNEGVAVVSDLPTATPSALPADTPEPMSQAPLINRAWPEVNSGRLISTLWIAGTALFLLLALVDRVRMWRLVAKAREPRAELSSHYTSVGSALGCRRLPRLFETDDLESPALIGTLAPVILIPTWLARDPNRAKLDWALRHELMHWKLFDPIAGLVRQLAQILFYFHPVAWWAGRKWEEATELACDRAIVKSAEDSRDYAEQLYGMLMQIRNRRRMPVSSGLFATRTQIGRRIAALLSGAHAAPARLSALAVAGVLVLSAVTLSIGGTFADKSDKPIETVARSVVSITDQTPPLDSPVNGGNANTPSPSTGRAAFEAFELAANDNTPAAVAAEPIENQTITIRGRVLDPDERPFAGAKVFLLRSSQAERGSPLPTEILCQVVTDKNGQFALSVAAEPQRVLGTADFIDRRYQVVAASQGHGLDWQAMALGANTPELTLQLTADSSPIEGRVLSLEGRPVAGVRVRVVSISTAASDIDEWIARARKNGKTAPGPVPALSTMATMDGYYFSRNNSFFPSGKQLTASSLPGISDVVTGADGRFKIVGLGNDRLVTVALQGESTASTFLDAVTHRMEPLPLPMADPRYRTPFYFGTAFDYPAEPTQIVTGIVRDADSGQPLPSIQVSVAQFMQPSFSVPGHLSDTTDAHGRYRIVGLPKGSDARRPARLLALPGSSQPYFRTHVNIPSRDELAPVTCDITLKRAVWLKGRLMDKSTGKPVLGLVSYYPFLDNPHALKYSNFSAGIISMGYDDRYATASDGTFMIPAVPGRGVAAAVALDGEFYHVADGAHELEWTTPRQLTGNERRLVFHLIGPALSNAVRGVDINELAGESTADIDLVPWRQQAIHVKDLAGDPLKGVEVVGAIPVSALNFTERYNIFGKVSPAASESVVIFGIDPDQQRRVLLLHAEKRIGGTFLIDEKTTEIRLDACATIFGRIVDSKRRPVSKQHVVAMIPESEFPATSNNGEAETFGSRPHLVQAASTDDAGRFRFDRILPGVRYQIASAQGATADVAVVKPGESIDLGTLKVKELGDEPQADEKAAEQETDATAESSATKTDRTPPLNSPANGGRTNALSPSTNEGKVNAPSPSTNRGTANTPSQSTGKTTSPSPSATRAGVGAGQVASGDKSTAAELPKPQDNGTFVVRGRVLDPDGKPFAGATVYTLAWYWSPEIKRVPLAESKSAADGRFEISYRNPKLMDAAQSGRMSGDVATIAAVASGYGPGFVLPTSPTPADELTLQLVRDDLPIAGRVLDLEGRPVTGVRVSVIGVMSPKGGDLSAWLDSIRQGEVNTAALRHIDAHLPDYEVPGAPRVITDAAGRYRITGVGRERIARLLFEGPTIAYNQVDVVTRRIAPMQMVTRVFDNKTRPLYGADLDLTASPTQHVVGTVRDAATGKPVAGVTVTNSSWPPGIVGARLVRTVTDQSGRYRLTGLPKSKGIEIMAIPNDEEPYFMQDATVPDAPGLEPITVDFELHRGIWIVGRITDKATGQPVPATMHYYPLLSNEYAQKRTPEFGRDGNVQGMSFHERYTTRADGSYRLVGLPGRAIVGVVCNGRPYRMGVGSDAIAGLDKYGHFPTYRNNVNPSPKWPHSMKEINPPEGAESAQCDIELDPGESARITVVDPENKPIAGYKVSGQTPLSYHGDPLEQSAFDVMNLGRDETRIVLIHHEARKLGKAVIVRVDGNATPALVVKLEPLATVTGRLLNADGDPVPQTMHLHFNVLPHGDFGKELPGVPIDKEGRFRHDAILPGCEYTIFAEGNGIAQVISEKLSVKPGETIDLGDVRLKP